MAITHLRGPRLVPQEAPSTPPRDTDTLREDLDDVQQQIERLPPGATGRWEYVDVPFDTADMETEIAHTLRPADPEAVRWVVVSVDGPAVVHRVGTASRRAWTATSVYLAASELCTARLLLFLEPSTNA